MEQRLAIEAHESSTRRRAARWLSNAVRYSSATDLRGSSVALAAMGSSAL